MFKSFLYLIAFIAVLSNFGCGKTKCREAMDNAKTQTRDTNLIGLWRLNDSAITAHLPATDSVYISFGNNGEYKQAYQISEIEQGGEYYWSTSDGHIILTGCSEGFPTIDNSRKYNFKGSTLTLYDFEASAGIYYPKKMVKVK